MSVQADPNEPTQRPVGPEPAHVPRLRREVIVTANEQARLSAMIGVSSLSGIAVGLTLSLILGFAYVPVMQSRSHRHRASATVVVAPAIERTWLGANVVTARSEAGLSGARVLHVHENSPAQRAGLMAGDIIRTVDGTTVRSSEHLVRLVRAVSSGTEVVLGFDRNDKRSVATPRLVTAPPQVAAWLD